jgi:hypothetical protein
MGIDLHLSTCVGTQSPKYLEMAQGHMSLSMSPPMLVMPDLRKGFDIYCDACGQGFGCVLMQEGHVIIYAET